MPALRLLRPGRRRTLVQGYLHGIAPIGLTMQEEDWLICDLTIAAQQMQIAIKFKPLEHCSRL